MWWLEEGRIGTCGGVADCGQVGDKEKKREVGVCAQIGWPLLLC